MNKAGDAPKMNNQELADFLDGSSLALPESSAEKLRDAAERLRQMTNERLYPLSQLVAIVERCEERRIDARVQRIDLGDVIADLSKLIERREGRLARCCASEYVVEMATGGYAVHFCALDRDHEGEHRTRIINGYHTSWPNDRESAKATSPAPWEGKQHCGSLACGKDPYANDECDCACDTRCGPYNEWAVGERLRRQGAGAPQLHLGRRTEIAWGIQNANTTCGVNKPSHRYASIRKSPRICPSCDGRRGHYEPGVAHTDVWVDCRVCGGNGIVSADPPAPPASVGTPGCSFCQHIAPGPHDTCVVCGASHHAGLGHWAVHADEDNTPVCTGPCFRAYEAKKKADAAERDLLDTLARWGSL